MQRTRPANATKPSRTNNVHPKRRTPITHDRPVPFGRKGQHCFGYRISALPAAYVTRVVLGIPYYIANGIYYRMVGGVYYVCRPPYGVIFDPVLDGAALTACTFAYYAQMNYAYSTMNENAQIIMEQNEIIAANNAIIAAQNETIALQSEVLAGQAAALSSDNYELAQESYLLADKLGLVQSYASISEEYYYEDGVFFKKSGDNYVTIVPPAGALVDELPEDYDEVEMDGNVYYRVEDTVYCTTVIDGKLYFEVLGQVTGEQA